MNSGIERQKNKHSSKYRARFSINNTRFCSEWLPTEADAKDWLAQTRVAVRNGQTATGCQILVKDFASLWLDKHAFASNVYSAAIKSKQHLDKYLIPKLGKVRLNRIRTADLDFLISDLRTEGRLSPKTINNIIGTLKKLFNDAVRWEYLSISPAVKISPLKININDVTYLYFSEMVSLLEYTRGNCPGYHELIEFGAHTGCRLGECLGLAWENIVEIGERKYARISQIYDSAKRQIVERTKGKRFRMVPLNPDAANVLANIRSNRSSEARGLIFPDLNYEYITKEKFKRLLKDAGLHDALERGATFHSIRHSFASEHMRTGGDISKLRAVLGHSSQKLTDRYIHFGLGYLAGATDHVSFRVPTNQCNR